MSCEHCEHTPTLATEEPDSQRHHGCSCLRCSCNSCPCAPCACHGPQGAADSCCKKGKSGSNIHWWSFAAGAAFLTFLWIVACFSASFGGHHDGYGCRPNPAGHHYMLGQDQREGDLLWHYQLLNGQDGSVGHGMTGQVITSSDVFVVDDRSRQY